MSVDAPVSVPSAPAAVEEALVAAVEEISAPAPAAAVEVEDFRAVVAEDFLPVTVEEGLPAADPVLVTEAEAGTAPSASIGERIGMVNGGDKGPAETNKPCIHR